MNFDIAELIRVIAENCPNETVAAFIMTYGVFIIAIVLIVIVLIRWIKKIDLNKNSSDASLSSLKESLNTEINVLRTTLATITDSAARTAVDNAKVTDDIKNEIRANNDATMQLMIAFGLANNMSYTDIINTIEKAKTIYNTSVEQYDALNQEVQSKIAEEAKAKAEEEAKAEQEALLKAQEEARLEAEAKAKADEQAKLEAQYKADLAAIKII